MVELRVELRGFEPRTEPAEMRSELRVYVFSCCYAGALCAGDIPRRVTRRNVAGVRRYECARIGVVGILERASVIGNPVRAAHLSPALAVESLSCLARSRRPMSARRPFALRGDA
jgi:hypothetical protein